MTVRSHWISITVFFLCGTLTGVVGSNQVEQARSSNGISRLLDAGFSIRVDHERADPTYFAGRAAMGWLLKTRAGRPDLACDEAQDRVKAAIQLGARDSLPPATQYLADQWTAWEQGSPFTLTSAPALDLKRHAAHGGH